MLGEGKTPALSSSGCRLCGPLRRTSVAAYAIGRGCAGRRRFGFALAPWALGPSGPSLSPSDLIWAPQPPVVDGSQMSPR